MSAKSKLYLLAGLSFLAGNAMAQHICISTPNTSLVLNAPNGGELKYLYYGSKLSETDLQHINEASNCNHTAYPVYGMNCPGEAALSVKHADGNMSTQMEVVSVSTNQEKQSTLTTVHLKDKVYPFYVDVHYKAYQDVDMIETWTEISHTEKKPVYLSQFSSAYLPIRRGNVWLSHLSGSWANEGQLTQEPLQPGMTVIKNKDGVRNSHTSHAEVMFSLDGKPQENTGRVIGAALCYTGNYKLKIDTDDSDYHQFYAGINEENSSYMLPKKEVFRTPAVALTYSDKGLSGASRNFHKWGRTYKLAHGNVIRDILLNSWEGVYFDINQKGMDQMMSDIASMGGELFVMDDGWFGDKYPRKNDSSSLGDWVTDKNKLPEGIEGLIRDAKKHGIKFGIWIEPEMANTISELYEKHPEWILKAPQRDPVLGRGGTQVVLDLANPEVQDFVFKVVDDLMTQYPDIAYIKWDANMAIMNHGSNYLTADKQSHMYIEYHKGFESVCQRIRAKYPDLVIQACASGGGRANYGYLPYFDEFWVSDNTDALQRIYMQWGTSYFYPSNAMAQHISASPNHQTGRIIPIKFRCDVAMSGRLGMELQPSKMTKEEYQQTAQAIKDYKSVRDVIQLGNLYRLVSPYDDKGIASLMYTDDTENKAVFFAYKMEHFNNQVIPRVCLRGLDPSKNYRVRELNVKTGGQPCFLNGKTFSGTLLMNTGIEMPLGSDYASCVLELTAE